MHGVHGCMEMGGGPRGPETRYMKNCTQHVTLSRSSVDSGYCLCPFHENWGNRSLSTIIKVLGDSQRIDSFFIYFSSPLLSENQQVNLLVHRQAHLSASSLKPTGMSDTWQLYWGWGRSECWSLDNNGSVLNFLPLCSFTN